MSFRYRNSPVFMVLVGTIKVNAFLQLQAAELVLLTAHGRVTAKVVTVASF